MTALTAVSRVTGFARIVVVAAVLGTTFLGNTYQSANTIPNVLFELLAAGALQAVLIPTLVRLVDSETTEDADHVAGAVLGLAGVVLAALSLLGILLSPLIMRGLVSGVSDPAVRDAQVRLGVLFLVFFLPQTVFYAAGTVATAALNAKGRFVVPVAAPIVNNVVVIGAYAAFRVLRHGAAPSLDLTLAQKLVLAGGTTAAVIAFCAVPVIAARRVGFTLRPNLDRHHPAVRRLARQGAWAAIYLALTQVLLVVVLLLANRIEGGVVAYQVGFTLFLLPHALFAVPALTALFPRLSRQTGVGDWDGFGESITRGIDAIAFFGLASAAALFALAHPVARLVLYGASAHSAGAVAGALRGFAVGIVGYGAFLFLTRAFYALHDARTPAVANAVVVLAGSAAMVVAFAAAAHPTVGLLAAIHSAVYLVGGAALLAALAIRHRVGLAALGRTVASHAVAAALTGAVMVAVNHTVTPSGRAGALVTVVLATLAGGLTLVAARLVLRPAGAHVLPELLAPRG
ncbi:MAG TPA: lipid II flippase MurJ [Acidimicrobiales bacterium]|nr:lipid II flippase MurJ [Acidimicrobiales bacterium]